MFKRSLLHLIAAMALAVALGGPASILMPPSAEAAGRATLARDIYLELKPPAGSTASIERNIYLSAGTYAWRAVLSRANGISGGGYREIYLAADTYRWVMTTRYLGYRGGYEEISTLSRSSGGTGASVSGSVVIGSEETYIMNSTLERI
ncbi:hypothetical protein [Amycolatopsis sp. lyj-109]|uniref:hypothetical protein n=1 Tax=Amycolatopsis sp. lyj-109 TaxID=2789287 RepID=UPI00397CFDA3